MITYTVNGESTTTETMSVEQLVVARIGSDSGVAVALDGAVVPRSQWSRMLEDGNCVELLTAVQGG